MNDAIESPSVQSRSVRPGRGAVTCVLLNWNSWQDTVECLGSLARQQHGGLQVLVVDNASTNDSVRRIRERCPEVEVIESAVNGGFAAGCNLGIRRALETGSEFVWLLNNDTSAPPETLGLLLEGFGDSRVGIVGTVLRYARDPARIQAWGGGEMLSWMGYVRHYTSAESFGKNSFLTFASVLIRREVFEEIGLLDEGYFMYFEDADLCFRARRAGWRLGVAPETAVLHKEGGSAPRRSLAKERIVTRSGLRFVSTHAGMPQVARVIFVLSKLAKRAVHGDGAGMWAVLLGVADWRGGRATGMEEGTR